MKLRKRRMDDQKRDEPPGTGEFILYGEFSSLAQGRDKTLVFTPPL